MRILVYNNGSAILEEEGQNTSARINGKEPDSILIPSDANMKKHFNKTLKEFQDERKAFHQLQQRSKKG